MQTEAQRRWLSENSERMKAYHKEYRHKNKDRIKKWQKDWRLKNMEHDKARRHRTYMGNFLRNAELGRLRQEGYKKFIVNALGGNCFCCGESDLVFLTLEHLNADGNVHRAKGTNIYRDVIKEGIPKDKYGVLCMNCNFARRFGKKCPHQKPLLELLSA